MLIFAYHVYPDPAVGGKRVSELANHLASTGWDVDIVCSDAETIDASRVLDHRIKRYGIARPMSLGLRLMRVLRPNRAKSTDSDLEIRAALSSASSTAVESPAWLRKLASLYHRAVGLGDDFKLWSTLAALRALRLPERPDVVVTSGPPWMPVFAASRVARNLGVPLVVDFRDPWVWGVGGSRDLLATVAYYLNSALEGMVLRTATVITVTTERFRMSLLQRRRRWADKTLLFRNGFDPEMLIVEPGPRGRLEMLYAGTIYLNRNPIPLLEGIAALLAVPQVVRENVHLRLVGNCSHWQGIAMTDLIDERGLRGVVDVCGLVSGAEVRNLTLEANVIVNFAQGQPDQVPAKLYEQIASHRFGLLFAEPHSESAALIQRCARIRRVDDDDTQILGELRRLYGLLVEDGRASQQLAGEDDVSEHRRDAVNAAYAALLRSVATCERIARTV